MHVVTIIIVLTAAVVVSPYVANHEFTAPPAADHVAIASHTAIPMADGVHMTGATTINK